jgi:hypothetical protein
MEIFTILRRWKTNYERERSEWVIAGNGAAPSIKFLKQVKLPIPEYK